MWSAARRRVSADVLRRTLMTRTTHTPRTTVALLAATCLLGGGALAAPADATKPGSDSATGTGSVFMVNPVQSSGDQSLTDQKDAASAVPATAYATVPLRNLD